jgi:hypothetical protein
MILGVLLMKSGASLPKGIYFVVLSKPNMRIDETSFVKE